MVLAFLKSVILNMRAFGGVPGRVDSTGNSQKHKGNRQLTSPKVKKFRDGGSFLGCADFFSIFSLFTTKNGVK